jgi:hypothetical protein
LLSIHHVPLYPVQSRNSNPNDVDGSPLQYKEQLETFAGIV